MSDAENTRPIGDDVRTSESGEDPEQTLIETTTAQKRLRSDLKGVTLMYEVITRYSMTELLDADINTLIEKVDALVTEDAEHREVICAFLEDDEEDEIIAAVTDKRIQRHKLVGKMRALERARESYRMALQVTRLVKTLEATDRLMGRMVEESETRIRSYMAKIQTAVDTIDSNELAVMAADLEPRMQEVFRRFDEAVSALPPKPDVKPDIDLHRIRGPRFCRSLKCIGEIFGSCLTLCCLRICV